MIKGIFIQRLIRQRLEESLTTCMEVALLALVVRTPIFCSSCASEHYGFII